MDAPRETPEPETHLTTLLALGRIVVRARRATVDESWFVLLTGMMTGECTIVRVDG